MPHIPGFLHLGCGGRVGTRSPIHFPSPLVWCEKCGRQGPPRSTAYGQQNDYFELDDGFPFLEHVYILFQDEEPPESAWMTLHFTDAAPALRHY